MLGQTSLLQEKASLFLQLETDQVALSQDVASQRNTRFLWTGFGFAALMLIGVPAFVLVPSASHASATPSHDAPAVAVMPSQDQAYLGPTLQPQFDWGAAPPRPPEIVSLRPP
jgi:hypothetical protein